MTIVCFESLHVASDLAIVSAMLEEAARLPSVQSAWVGAPAAGSANAGDLFCRIVFDNLTDWQTWRDDAFWDKVSARAAIAKMTVRDRIVYSPGEGASRKSSEGAVWRGLVFALKAGASETEAERLATGLLTMPVHISEIRGGRLSKALESTGMRHWTHMWEQEFDCAEALRGNYLMNPVHWSHVDGWFDVECPQWIVDPCLIHCLADVGVAISL